MRLKDKGRIICLVGQIASGKSTLAGCLERIGFERIVTYTTRPPREGERDGADYHFISGEAFLRKAEDGFFAEYSAYNALFGYCCYGTARKSLETSGGVNRVIVLNPRGVITLKKAGFDIFVICLDFDQETLMRRALKRGDDPAEIGRRVAEDAPLFALLEAEHFVDLYIRDAEMSPEQTVELLRNMLI